MNPELRRNLWLQFSPGRLLLAPICLGLILVSVWIVTFHVYSVVALLSEWARAVGGRTREGSNDDDFVVAGANGHAHAVVLASLVFAQ